MRPLSKPMESQSVFDLLEHVSRVWNRAASVGYPPPLLRPLGTEDRGLGSEDLVSERHSSRSRRISRVKLTQQSLLMQLTED